MTRASPLHRLRAAAGRSRLGRSSLVRRLRSRAATPAPALSVVLPVYNVAPYLDACLESLWAQTFADFEVIAVDDGSTDGSLALLCAAASAEPRLRVLTQANAGQGSARNRGIAQARGEFLTFVDSDDTLPPRALQRMVRSLRTSGSDFVVGTAVRVFSDGTSMALWTDTVHQRDRTGVTLDQFPVALQDILACNRMFRTEFWRRAVGRFPVGVAYEDHLPMLQALVRARRFNVLRATTYHWMIRHDGSSTAQQKASLQNLRDRITVKEDADAFLGEEASTAIHDMWLARTLEVDFPPFYPFAIDGSEEYRADLQNVVARFLSRASPAARDAITFNRRLRAWLVAQGRWDDLAKAERAVRVWGLVPPTTAPGNGTVLADLSLDLSFAGDAPAEIRLLSAQDTVMLAGVQTAAWVGPDRIRLSGYCLIRGLTASPERQVELWLASPTGEQVPLTVRAAPDVTVGNQWASATSADQSLSGFHAEIDLAAVPTPLDKPVPWRLHGLVRQDGLTRTTDLFRVTSASPRRAVARRFEREKAVVLLGVEQRRQGLELVARRPIVFLDRLDFAGGMLSGEAHVADNVAPPDEVGVDEVRAATLSATGEHTFSFSVPVPAAGDAPALWARWAGGTPVGLIAPHDAVPGDPVGDAQAWWAADAQLVTRVHVGPPALFVDDVRLEGDGIVVDLRVLGLDAGELSTARLATGTATLALRAEPQRQDDHRWTLCFERTARVLGGDSLPAPSGAYALWVGHGDGVVAAEFGLIASERLPIRLEDDLLCVRPGAEHGSSFRLRISAPLPAELDSPVGKRAQQRRYRATTYEPRNAVFFQCYRGEFATDSQLVLDHQLAAARPNLTRYWGVADSSVGVPQGSIPVIIGTPAWYDAIGSSRFLCNNIDFDAWFEKAPFQRYLQTFHGYPFKSMGRAFWAGKRLPEHRIRQEINRRRAEYDAIVVPSEEAAQQYRDTYEWDGRFLVTGYPRTDPLVLSDRDEVRTRTLERLGVDPAKTVVLYAPTYRDELTTRTFAARLFDELDLVELTDSLGTDHVVLLRGHNNNQREADRVRGVAGVVDVTDYPDVNDLTLAADVAILDYSSLRFDWALTRRPMVFFVPDRETYFGRRPPLFPFEESAPGPWTRTTAETVSWLRDLARLHHEYAGAIDAFNDRFNRLHDGGAARRVVESFFD